jgi:hypothetical protein
MLQAPTMELDASLFLSTIAAVIAIYTSVLQFFAKREMKSLDEAKKKTYENASDILVIHSELKQLTIDIQKSNEKTDDIVNNYKASFREVNSKLDAMTEGINSIKVTCAGHLARS